MEKTMDRRTANQWAFLGAALMDPEAARPYMSRMVAAMFAPGGCREVFAAVQRLSLGGQAVDVITVANAAPSTPISGKPNLPKIRR